MKNNIRKYALLQISLVIIFGLYAIGMVFGSIYFLNSINDSSSESSEVTVTLLVQSNHPDFPINFTSTATILVNLPLLEHLNNTVGEENWSGTDFGIQGWYVDSIFNVSESSPWKWIYYYRENGTSTWSLSPVGVSGFIINRDFEIMFVYDNS